MSEDKYPKVVVGALISNSAGEILLIKQSKWKETFSIPGGHVEWGEKLEEAITREVDEETGLKVTDLQQFNVSEYVLGDENAAEKHYIFIDFVCKTDNNNVTLGEEASEYCWVKPQDALDLPLTSNTKALIQKYIDKVIS
jgi:nucleoside triphosphatase